MKPTWCHSFMFFHSHNPKKFNHWMASSRKKTWSTQNQTCMKYGGIIIFIKRNLDVNTGDLKILHKKCQNKVDFWDIILNFSKMVCVLPSTLCMTGELWPRRFIWYQDIRVTHCQSSAMSYIFTQYSFCNSFRHGLITRSHVFLGPLSPGEVLIVNIVALISQQIELLKSGPSGVKCLRWLW